MATDVPQPTRYFLIEGVIAADEDQERRIVRDGVGYAVAVGDSLFPAAPLEEDTLRALRRPHLEAVVRLRGCSWASWSSASS